MAGNRPRGRQKNVTGSGKRVYKRGSGLGTGPTGSAGGYSGRPSGGRNSEREPGGMYGRNIRGSGSSGGRGGFGKLIILGLIVLLGGGGSIGSMFLGDGPSQHAGQNYPGQSPLDYEQIGQPLSGESSSVDIASFLDHLGGGSMSTGWEIGSNVNHLDTTTADGSREKYTEILGDGKDTMTIMLYLCGTDLESQNGMATADIQEMINADLSDNINLLVYTGGCRKWKNSTFSSRTNQIWQVKKGGVVCLEEDLGSVSMTDPDTLSGFIRYCEEHYPANRYSFIFWDHGGGSVSGYGYDEKFQTSGSMNLAEIDEALTDGGVKFDFVGFDACLMATMENALMLTKHADYMIASEETEPGIGWYYTNWLTSLSKNPSIPTVELGKEMIDDFVNVCAQKCKGQSTTLSIVDLAELEHTIPNAFKEFAVSTSSLIQNDEYQTVSRARSGAREFAVSSKIDQVDMVHLATNMGTEEGKRLAEKILDAVKYNRTSSNMTNSYGLSIYFPYKKISSVDEMVSTYELIGLDEEYARCIQEFASMEVSGQAVSGGTSSPLPSLMGMLGSAGSGYAGSSSMNSTELIAQLLGGFLGGNVGNIAGLTSGNTGFLSDRSLSNEDMLDYLVDNRLDTSQLMWKDTAEGAVIEMSEDQWNLVQTLHANMFYDDGEGYIDLGLDTVYEFDEFGNLLAPDECTWLAVNEQPVAYYHESTMDDGEDYTITGRIPVFHNGIRAELVVTFTDEDPYGRIVGVRTVYKEGETNTVAKTMDPVVEGDTLDFICDYYSYEGEYLDSYMLGDPMIVEGELEISDVYVDENAAELTYLLTDIYNQQYWTEPVPGV